MTECSANMIDAVMYQMNYVRGRGLNAFSAIVKRGVDASWTSTAMIDRAMNEAITALYGCALNSSRDVSFLPDDPAHILRALSLPREKVRVIIIAQDPYPRKEDACGIAFQSLSPKCPRSMKMLNKNLIKHGHLNPSRVDNADLSAWTQQGVLLLNRYPTIPAGYSRGAEHALIWREFTNQIVMSLPSKIVALLLGNEAQALSQYLPRGAKVVAHPHPSARMSSAEYHAKDVFGEINWLLREMQLTPIDWSH